MFELDRNKQTITIDGVSYSKNEILKDIPTFARESEFGLEVYGVLKEWFSDSVDMLLHTSGSTGTPKPFLADKDRMMQSAKLTCSFLDLKKGDDTLLCLPVSAIAGKMILVRALIANLNIHLVTPCGSPLKDIDINLKFAAMVPMQVFNSLQSPKEKIKLENIENIIVGGGVIDSQLEVELQSFKNNIYSTYGMTETLSHIALRRISGQDASLDYTPFQSVKISSSSDGCLVIDAPLVSKEILYTNDLVEINSCGGFRITGRKDNIINTGGVKIQIEKLEEKLSTILKHHFAITSRPDVKFGEVIVLVTEQPFDTILLTKVLSDYEIPKDIIVIDKIPLTRTGKIDRASLKKIALDSDIAKKIP